MNSTIQVLLTGLGSPAAIGVIKSLKKVTHHQFRIIGMDIKQNLPAERMVDRFYQAPVATSPDFIPFVKQVCSVERIQIILPLVTAELEPFASHRHEFEQLGTIPAVSSTTAIRTCTNKAILFDTLAKHGVCVPSYQVATTAKQLKQAIRDMGYPKQVVCFKPTIGDGGRGFHILDAAKDRFHQLFCEKQDTAYVSAIDVLQILQSHPEIPQLLVMEFLPGKEYSIDLLANEGEVILAIPRSRERVVGGITVEGTIHEEEDVISYCKEIVRILCLHGNIGIQVRRDSQGRPKLLEVNPRLQGTTIHCTAAGVNFPYLGIKLFKGFTVEKEELRVQWGTKMVRYWEESFIYPSTDV